MRVASGSFRRLQPRAPGEPTRRGAVAPSAPSDLCRYPSLGTMLQARSRRRCTRTAESRTHEVSSLTGTARRPGLAIGSPESSTAVFPLGDRSASSVHRIVGGHGSGDGPRLRENSRSPTIGTVLVAEVPGPRENCGTNGMCAAGSECLCPSLSRGVSSGGDGPCFLHLRGP